MWKRNSRWFALPPGGPSGFELTADTLGKVDTLCYAFAENQEPTDLTIAGILTDFVSLSKLMSEQINGLRQ